MLHYLHSTYFNYLPQCLYFYKLQIFGLVNACIFYYNSQDRYLLILWRGFTSQHSQSPDLYFQIFLLHTYPRLLELIDRLQQVLLRGQR